MTFAALCGPALADDQAPLTAKDVKTELTSHDIARLFPEAAVSGGISGNVDALCTVAADGSLTECQIVAETPEKQGFGKAALSVSKLTHVSALAKDGSPTAGRKFLFHMTFGFPKH
jgi:protein TonB